MKMPWPAFIGTGHGKERNNKMSLSTNPSRVKRRKLPKTLHSDELAGYGYILLSDTRAKHHRYGSYRHRCDGCGLWCHQLLNGLCRKCLSKSLDEEFGPAPRRRVTRAGGDRS